MRAIAMRGMALDKLLVGIIAISVLSTAMWNYQVRNTEIWADPLVDGRTEERIKQALDDIKYHIVLAGYERTDHSYTVEHGRNSDVLKIRHNGVNVEYCIDSENNLIRKLESAEQVMAEGISSLRSLSIGENTAVITISRSPMSTEKKDEIETLSKSYSVFVEMNNLL